MTRQDRLRQKYGLTEADYARLLDMQDGKCAICREAPQGTNPNNRVLAVDHLHNPGEKGPVRGLLCISCNLGLGCFSDDPSRLAAAIRYLTHGRGSLQDLRERYDEEDFNCPTNGGLTERDMEERDYETR